MRFQLCQPFLSKPQYQPALWASFGIAEDGYQGLQELLQLVSRGHTWMRVQFFHLVQEHDQRSAALLFVCPPCFRNGHACRCGLGAPLQFPEQVVCRVPEIPARLVEDGLQRVQQLLLPGWRRSVGAVTRGSVLQPIEQIHDRRAWLRLVFIRTSCLNRRGLHRRKRPVKGCQQPIRTTAQIPHFVIPLEPWNHAGVEERRFTHAGLAVEQHDGCRARRGQAVVERSGLMTTTEEHFGVFLGEPVQMPIRAWG